MSGEEAGMAVDGLEPSRGMVRLGGRRYLFPDQSLSTEGRPPSQPLPP